MVSVVRGIIKHGDRERSTDKIDVSSGSVSSGILSSMDRPRGGCDVVALKPEAAELNKPIMAAA